MTEPGAVTRAREWLEVDDCRFHNYMCGVHLEGMLPDDEECFASSRVRDLLAAYDALAEDYAQIEFAEGLTHQSCIVESHPDWYVNAEHTFMCPWCAKDRLAAMVDECASVIESAESERDQLKAAVARVRAEAEAYAYQPGVLEPCGAVAQGILAALDGDDGKGEA